MVNVRPRNQQGITLISRNEIIRYFVNEYFEGSSQKASEASGCPVAQIEDWLEGRKTPQKNSVDYFIHCTFVPEFSIVVEFGEFDPKEQVRPQLRKLFEGHEDKAGIYAFYDSMANLLYIGKATNLLEESYAAIRRDVHVPFPAGIKNRPEFRYQIVRYVSAYDVGTSDWVDYPKHVESLILRISKPLLNKNIGILARAEPASREA